MSAAILRTSEGEIALELFEEDAPRTVANFKQLAGQGFYDGLGFHRIVQGFVAAKAAEWQHALFWHIRRLFCQLVLGTLQGVDERR